MRLNHSAANWGHARTLIIAAYVRAKRATRQDAKPGPVKMYGVPPGRAWWPAVGAALERGVRLPSWASHFNAPGFVCDISVEAGG